MNAAPNKIVKVIPRITGLIMVTLTLVLTAGCDTPTGQGAGVGAVIGAVTGGVVGAVADRRHPGTGALIGSAIGAASGALIGGALGRISEEQQEQLRAQSPQTLQTIQYNDQLAQQPPPPPPSGPSTPPPASAPSGVASTPDASAPAAAAPVPLKVDDIKALTAAGVKKDVIISAIKESKATYTPADIAVAQQAVPPIDPDVIAFMKNPAS